MVDRPLRRQIHLNRLSQEAGPPLVATIIISSCLMAIGLLRFFEFPAWITAWKLRHRKANRLTVLIARFDGENAQDIKDRIREQMQKVFGQISNRALDVVDFPLTIVMPDTGSQTASYLKATRKGRRWLTNTKADLLLWGHARHIPEQATIYFLLPKRKAVFQNELNLKRLGAPDAQLPVVEGIRIYDFAKAPELFGTDAAAAVAAAALACIQSIFTTEPQVELSPHDVTNFVAKLETYIDLSPKETPKNLIQDIRSGYSDLLIELGRQGNSFSWQKLLVTLDNKLGAIDKTDKPKEWADIAIDNASISLEAGEQLSDQSLTKRAIDLYRQILEIISVNDDLYKWAEANDRLAFALTSLAWATGSSAEALEAIDISKKVLLTVSSDNDPHLWAICSMTLANTLAELGYNSGDIQKQTEAISLYRGILSTVKRDDAPEIWVVAQSKLGDALDVLGSCQGNPEVIEHAIDAFLASAKEADKHGYLDVLFEAQRSLANAYRNLGRVAGDRDAIEEAISRYQDLVGTVDRARYPIAWANIQNEFGLAYYELHEFEINSDCLRSAITAYRNALIEFTPENNLGNWAAVTNNLGNALRILGEREGNLAMLEEAIVGYRNVLREYEVDPGFGTSR